MKKKVLEMLYLWTVTLPEETKIADAYYMLKKQGEARWKSKISHFLCLHVVVFSTLMHAAVCECSALTSRVSLLIVIWFLGYPLLSFYG